MGRGRGREGRKDCVLLCQSYLTINWDPNPRPGPVPVLSLLGIRLHRWAVGKQAKVHLPLPRACYHPNHYSPPLHPLTTTLHETALVPKAGTAALKILAAPPSFSLCTGLFLHSLAREPYVHCIHRCTAGTGPSTPRHFSHWHVLYKGICSVVVIATNSAMPKKV